MQEIDIVDYHLHSKYSIPSSPLMDLSGMVEYAKIKGVTILGTGDVFLPEWEKTLKDSLSFENGFYYFNDFPFILTGEVNLTFERIVPKKFHVVLAFPTFKDVENFKNAFKGFSDFTKIARPNIKIEPKEFLKILKDLNPEIPVILAHVFTPHFGALGSSNDFKSLDEIFEGELPTNIFVETGLSADPKMVYSVKELRDYPVISSSDSHSPEHIGREATAIKKSSSFSELFENLKEKTNIFTLENFPQLGKYYLDGHRKCKFKTDDFQILKCPVCGKELTKGVLHRVTELKDTREEENSETKYFYIIPLTEILKKTYKRAEREKVYFNIISEFGNELNVMLFSDLEDLSLFLNEKAIIYLSKIREGNLIFDCGYDGIYGDWEVNFA